MNCPHCQSENTYQYTKTTSLGYRVFKCHSCGRTFNERTGTSFNYLQFPTDIVLLVVLWRIRWRKADVQIRARNNVALIVGVLVIVFIGVSLLPQG
ncbi:MAG: hypothetical protein ABI947_20360 [Chloroflexota bacterium]